MAEVTLVQINNRRQKENILVVLVNCRRGCPSRHTPRSGRQPLSAPRGLLQTSPLVSPSMSSSNRFPLAPAWMTVKVRPPMVSVPVRALRLGLAVTV